MLALSNAQEGDVAVRTDLNKSFILKASPYSTLANWQELLTPTDAVTSVNGSTGAVTISLAGLGGVASTTYNTHVASNLHLTETQRTILSNVKDIYIGDSDGIAVAASETEYANNVIIDGLLYVAVVDSNYTPTRITYKLGIDTSKVLTPSSIIDGGTY
jgi:hypothetical protein